MITTNAGLQAALDKCSGGESIDEGLNIREPVIIRDRSYGKAVRIVGGEIAPSVVQTYFSRSLDVANSTGLSFEQLKVRGKETTSPAGRAFDGIAVNVSYSQDISLVGVEVTEANRAVVADTVKRLTLVDSDIHTIQSDAIDFADCDDSLLARLLLDDFWPYILPDGSADHPDGIQFWATGKPKVAASDSTNNRIEDVLIRCDPMRRAQGIWPSDSVEGHLGLAIRRCLLVNMLWNGITLDSAPGAILEDTDVLSVARGPDMPGGPVIPRVSCGPDDQVRNVRAAAWINSGGWDAPAGSQKLGFSTEAEVAAAVAAWFARVRPTPTPAPTPPPSPLDLLKAERAALIAKLGADTPVRDELSRQITKTRARLRTVEKQIARLG